MYWDAAAIFVEDEIAHVCWALAIADAYDSRDYRASAVVREFQDTFAALEAGSETLQSGDILNAVDGDEQGFRDFSLWLLAMAAAIEEDEDV